MDNDAAERAAEIEGASVTHAPALQRMSVAAIDITFAQLVVLMIRALFALIVASVVVGVVVAIVTMVVLGVAGVDVRP